MITPGFFGFFNSYRGLLASQMALNTVNHNISNANTPGYSRQRVDMSAHFPYTLPTQINQDISKGQLGQGVQVDGVTRIRDSFIDDQFRQENSRLGTNEQNRNVLQQIEGVLNEPSTSGINSAIQELFNSAQALSLDPQNMAVRADFLQYAVDTLVVFEQQFNQLEDLQRNLVGDAAVPGSFAISQLGINVNDTNNILQEITNLNKQILTVISSGAEPNDLYDRRDLLLDELAELVDYEVTNTASGQINIDIANQRMVQGVTLVDTFEVLPNPVGPPTSDFEPSIVQTVNGGVDVLNSAVPNQLSDGKIKAIVDIAGGNTSVTNVRGLINDLDDLVTSIVTEINGLHMAGRDLNGASPTSTIFTGTDISNFAVNNNLLNDPRLIGAAEGPPNPYLGPGDGSTALDIAQLRDGSFAALGNTSYIEYFNGLVSNLGIDTRTFENRSDSQNVLMDSLAQRRESISGVNMDEELIDLVRYQRAFEATSRTIQTFDEIIQTIINMV